MKLNGLPSNRELGVKASAFLVAISKARTTLIHIQRLENKLKKFDAAENKSDDV